MDKLLIAQRYIDVATTQWGTTLDSSYQHDWRAWHELAKECGQIAFGLHTWLKVIPVNSDEPYPNVDAMGADIRDNQRFLVSARNCNHPLWTRQQNLDFRLVHDVLGHCGQDAIAGFSWKGELTAYRNQGRHHSELARRALFTEIVGQTAVRSVTKEFPQQKVFLYPPEFQEYIDNGGC